MSTTVIEALQNAKMNFETLGKMGAGDHLLFMLAREQLSNAIEALKNGKGPDDILQENVWGDVDTGCEMLRGFLG